jgi:hypothetical protein
MGWAVYDVQCWTRSSEPCTQRYPQVTGCPRGRLPCGGLIVFGSRPGVKALIQDRLLPEEHFRFLGGDPRPSDWYPTPERLSDPTREAESRVGAPVDRNPQ